MRAEASVWSQQKASVGIVTKLASPRLGERCARRPLALSGLPLVARCSRPRPRHTRSAFITRGWRQRLCVGVMQTRESVIHHQHLTSPASGRKLLRTLSLPASVTSGAMRLYRIRSTICRDLASLLFVRIALSPSTRFGNLRDHRTLYSGPHPPPINRSSDLCHP